MNEPKKTRKKRTQQKVEAELLNSFLQEKTVADFSKWTGIHQATVDQWQRNGKIPKYAHALLSTWYRLKSAESKLANLNKEITNPHEDNENVKYLATKHNVSPTQIVEWAIDTAVEIDEQKEEEVIENPFSLK